MQIWSVPEQIAYLSNLITLQPGDLIFSGTPAGVGPIKAGDKLEGHVDGVGDLTVTYRSSEANRADSTGADAAESP